MCIIRSSVGVKEQSMTNIATLKQAVDHLPPDEFAQLYEYVHTHAHAQTLWGVVPAENLRQINEIMRPVQEQAASMSENEINTAIDEAIAGVRHERKAQSRD